MSLTFHEYLNTIEYPHFTIHSTNKHYIILVQVNIQLTLNNLCIYNYLVIAGRILNMHRQPVDGDQLKRVAVCTCEEYVCLMDPKAGFYIRQFYEDRDHCQLFQMLLCHSISCSAANCPMKQLGLLEHVQECSRNAIIQWLFGQKRQQGDDKGKIFPSDYPSQVFYLHSNTLKLNIRQSNLPYKNLRTTLLYFSNYFCLPFTAPHWSSKHRISTM